LSYGAHGEMFFAWEGSLGKCLLNGVAALINMHGKLEV
jgi:hypothetical protein